VSPETLGKEAVSVTQRRNECFSLPSVPWHSANLFAECPRKNTRQRRFCRCIVCRAFFAECDTQQSLCRVLLRLCRVLQALGKGGDSGSASSAQHFLDGFGVSCHIHNVAIAYHYCTRPCTTPDWTRAWLMVVRFSWVAIPQIDP
jgi:hypothetical protein